MNDFASITEALELLVPPVDEAGDWEGIVLAAMTADARERPRRRKPVFVAAVVVAVLISVTALAVAGTGPWWLVHPRLPFWPGPAKGSHTVLVTRGSWSGREWALTAYRGDRDTVCYQLVAAPTNNQQAPQGGTACALVPGTTAATSKHTRGRLTITYEAGGLAPTRNGSEIRYVAGPVIPEATEVVITLANGTILHTPTVAAPKGLGLAIRFYAVPVPTSHQNPASTTSCAQRIAQQLASMRPAKLVGLDAAGKPVAELTVPAQPPGFVQSICRPHLNHFGPPPELAGKPFTTIGHVVGPYGARATIAVSGVVGLHLARPLPSGKLRKFVQPSRCWRVNFSNGQSQGTCMPVAKSYEPVLSPWLQHAGRDTFVFVDAPPRIGATIARVDLQLASGRTLSKRPVDGVVVFAIPKDALSTTRSQRGFLIAYDKTGKRLVQDNSFGHARFTRQPVYYRSCPTGSSCSR